MCQINTMKFHSTPFYDEKYIKTKVREFHSVIKTNFMGDIVPKENIALAQPAQLLILL